MTDAGGSRGGSNAAAAAAVKPGSATLQPAAGFCHGTQRAAVTARAVAAAGYRAVLCSPGHTPATAAAAAAMERTCIALLCSRNRHSIAGLAGCSLITAVFVSLSSAVHAADPSLHHPCHLLLLSCRWRRRPATTGQRPRGPRRPWRRPPAGLWLCCSYPVSSPGQRYAGWASCKRPARTGPAQRAAGLKKQAGAVGGAEVAEGVSGRRPGCCSQLLCRAAGADKGGVSGSSAAG